VAIGKQDGSIAAWLVPQARFEQLSALEATLSKSACLRVSALTNNVACECKGKGKRQKKKKRRRKGKRKGR